MGREMDFLARLVVDRQRQSMCETRGMKVSKGLREIVIEINLTSTGVLKSLN